MSEAYTILDDDELARRIKRNNINCFKDGMPTSYAFKTKKGENGLSVNILKLTTIEQTILDSSEYIVGVFLASVPISEGYECKHDPQPGNDAHALIMGDTHKIARKLSKICELRE